MASGNQSIDKTPSYEDYKSLKMYLRKNYTDYVPNTMKTIRFTHQQAGTGAEVELENKAGETIADIGKAGETWVAQISAYAEDVVVTLTWINSSNASTTQTVTLTGAAETAFTVAITTGYVATACSIDVVNPGGVTVKVGVTGMATPVATIEAAATAATEAGLSGVGRITAKQKTDQVGTDGGKDLYLPYITPWGTLKYGFATLSAVATNTEVVWYEASSAFVPTSVLVKDFYRRRTFTSELVAADEILLVAPGGATVYGVIPVSAMESVHSRYVCPTGRAAFLAFFCSVQAIASNLDCYMVITYTPYGKTVAHTCQVPIPNNAPMTYEPLFRAVENTEFKFVVKGNLADISFDIHILEIETV